MNTSAILARLNITLPKGLVYRLKKANKPRGISRFLAEAAREKLECEEAKKALCGLLEAPKSFLGVKDSVSFVRGTRSLDEKRLKRLGL